MSTWGAVDCHSFGDRHAAHPQLQNWGLLWRPPCRSEMRCWGAVSDSPWFFARWGIGGGGGGAASFTNILLGTARTIDATDYLPVNTDDPFYQPGEGSGGGRDGGSYDGYRGRVVMVVGGEGTIFSNTYTSQSSSYSSSQLQTHSHDFVVPH